MRFIALLLLALPYFSFAQVDPAMYQELDYRMIGPFRGGRTVGAVGVPSQPNVFYIGVNNGGVWKTDDYGRTWNPIFDDAPTGSIGDVAVSPSHPNVIYVGSGEGLHRPDLSVGDGIFKSTDGGKNWKHIGLDDIQQVARLIVHPTDPNIVYVAGLGHPYGANEMRGVYRTTDGGGSWDRVLYIDEHTGSSQVEMDPNNPQVLFASMWEHQDGPWENANFSGPNSGLYRSTDGGDTWTHLTQGLPTPEQGLGRIGVDIARSDSRYVYATVDADEGAGIYRSTDGGDSWSMVSDQYRLWGRGDDFGEIRVHPQDRETVFVGNIASYKSTDGGKSWTSIKGAPGGDDYHRIWINPEHPEVMLFAADQGATITVNGGRTWSSWYNQPTSQLYHVITDNQYPYWVYGGQQESGAIGVASRSNGGQISFREFMGVGADEYAYVAPDPKDSDIIYGGRVIRFNKQTGQSEFVGPEALRTGEVRYLRTMPLLFHPADETMLLFGANVIWKTHNGGKSWHKISPDLTRERPAVPASVGDYKTKEMETMRQRAIVYAIAPSPLNVDIIWAGTDDGLVHITQDGGRTWTDVTPPDLESWDKISQIDAGHHDAGTAYIAVNAIRKDNMLPLIYKTHDYGQTWKKITNGMNPMGPVNVVREDHTQPGLLFAGTEREVYFSIDDGSSWQSLRQNMPASSIRDLVIHEDDLVIGTHGRSIWIMDDFSPLRELAGSLPSAHLFAPTDAIRVRHNMFSDTPLPPEEPTGANPADGALIDYYLGRDAREVTLEIVDMMGKVIRRYAHTDPVEMLDSTKMAHPTYWKRPTQRLLTDAGHHRFVWDMRYAEPRGARRGFSIAAVQYDTPSGPRGPFVMPGQYKVRLTVDGQTMEQPISIHLDPRVEISHDDLTTQHELTMQAYDDYHRLQTMRQQLDLQLKMIKGDKATKMKKLIGRGQPRDGDYVYGRISESSLADETIVGLQSKLLYAISALQGADVAPSVTLKNAVRKLHKRVDEVLEKVSGL